jgi:hypothetical protein
LPIVDCDDNNCVDSNIGENSSNNGSGKKDEDEFTPVLSRTGSGKKSNQWVPLCGTKSLKKVCTNHPLCDIVSRTHNKNVKYK